MISTGNGLRMRDKIIKIIKVECDNGGQQFDEKIKIRYRDFEYKIFYKMNGFLTSHVMLISFTVTEIEKAEHGDDDDCYYISEIVASV